MANTTTKGNTTNTGNMSKSTGSGTMNKSNTGSTGTMNRSNTGSTGTATMNRNTTNTNTNTNTTGMNQTGNYTGNYTGGQTGNYSGGNMPTNWTNWQENLWNWDPFREMSMLRDNMNDMLSNLLGYTYHTPNYYNTTMYPTTGGMYNTTTGNYPGTGSYQGTGNYTGGNYYGTGMYPTTTTHGSTTGSYMPGTTTTRMMNSWSPSMDIYQDKNNNLVYETSMPGMNKNNINISVTDNFMTVSGETVTNNEVKEGNYYYKESRTGKYTRTVPLPENCNPDKIKAEYKDGILKITMPMNKSEKTKTVKVDVK